MKGGAKTLLFAIVLVSLCGCGRGAHSDEVHPTLGVLDPSDPAQLAVIHWHEALVASDFGKFDAVQVRGTDDTADMRMLAFDVFRKGVPKDVFGRDATHDFDGLSPASDETLKGLRTFALIGCARAAANGQPVRVMSVVSVRKIGGEWKVYGGTFGAPSTPFAGGCPVRAGA